MGLLISKIEQKTLNTTNLRTKIQTPQKWIISNYDKTINVSYLTINKKQSLK
jgi:hypothetical protein